MQRKQNIKIKNKTNKALHPGPMKIIFFVFLNELFLSRIYSLRTQQVCFSASFLLVCMVPLLVQGPLLSVHPRLGDLLNWGTSSLTLLDGKRNQAADLCAGCWHWGWGSSRPQVSVPADSDPAPSGSHTGQAWLLTIEEEVSRASLLCLGLDTTEESTSGLHPLHDCVLQLSGT